MPEIDLIVFLKNNSTNCEFRCHFGHKSYNKVHKAREVAYNISGRKEVNGMATSSITKDIVIRDKKASQQLISALENADGKCSQEVSYSKAHKEIRGEKIKEIFK